MKKENGDVILPNYSVETSTLKTLVTMKKLEADQDVRLAYRILQKKGYRKSQYILDCVKWYENAYTDEKINCLVEFIYPVKFVGYLKRSANIGTIKDLEDYLTSQDIPTLKTRCLMDRTPKTLMLGFNESEKAWFVDFMSKTMTERVKLITDAMKAYIINGKDSDITAWEVMYYDELLKLVKRYNSSESQADKNRLLSNLWLLMNCEEQMQAEWKISLPSYKNITSDLDFDNITIDPDDIEDLL